MTSYTITRTDLAGRPLILAVGPGGPVHLRWTGPSSAHEIYVPGADEVLARLLQAADAGGHHIDVQLADGGTLRVGLRGLDDGVRISHRIRPRLLQLPKACPAVPVPRGDGSFRPTGR